MQYIDKIINDVNKDIYSFCHCICTFTSTVLFSEFPNQPAIVLCKFKGRVELNLSILRQSLFDILPSMCVVRFWVLASSNQVLYMITCWLILSVALTCCHVSWLSSMNAPVMVELEGVTGSLEVPEHFLLLTHDFFFHVMLLNLSAHLLVVYTCLSRSFYVSIIFLNIYPYG